jgi:hypothetical protein
MWTTFKNGSFVDGHMLDLDISDSQDLVPKTNVLFMARETSITQKQLSGW